MIEPEFKIGDVLAPILDDTGLIKLHVVEIVTQTCCGGTQFHYICRIYTKSDPNLAPSISNYFKFNEMEVKTWKPKKKR